MAKTNIVSTRVDDTLKSDVETILFQLGLNTSDAINMFFRQIVLVGGIPFDVVLPKYNKETLEAMAESVRISKDPSVKGFGDMRSLIDSLEGDE